jgi:hypothetical protein
MGAGVVADLRGRSGCRRCGWKHKTKTPQRPSRKPVCVLLFFFRRVGYSEVLLSLLSSVEASYPCCLEGKSDLLVHWVRRIKIDVMGARSIGAKVC